MTRLRVCTVALVVATFGLAVFSPASAGENTVFGVSPHPDRLAGQARRAILVPAGGEREVRDQIRVWNRSADTVTLRVYAAEASVQSDGVVAIGGANPGSTTPAARIDVSSSSVRLGPGRDAIVAVTVPAQAFTTSGQLAAVVVEQENEDSRAGIDLVQRIAVLVKPSTAVLAFPAEGRRGVSRLALLAGAVGAAVIALAAWRRLRRRPVRDEDAAPAVPLVPEPVTPEPVTPEPTSDVLAPQPVASQPVAQPSVPVVAPAVAARPSQPARRTARGQRKLNYIPLDR